MNKVTIIGTGSVGSTIAYTLMVTGQVSEIVMIDVNQEKALGEALDIRQGTPFCSACSVYAGDYADAAGSNVVIITSGVARKPGQSRLDLAQTNVNILCSIIPSITRYAPEAYYIIVSNPVDILTYAFCRRSGVPESHVIGSGTILDTARLRTRLSEYYRINQHNVHAYVFGEHGDSSFIPWSLANVANVPVEQYSQTAAAKAALMPELDLCEVERYVRKSGARVIERKGATFYAVSAAVCHICRTLLSGIDTTMTVSTMMHGEYDIENVCLSVMNIVGRDGASAKILSPLTEAETALLHKSADALREVIGSLSL